MISLDDVKSLKNWLDRNDKLPSYQRELIEDAIYCLENGSEYRAEQSLKTMARNYSNDGDSDSSRAVERIL